jgi:hypothetical protein
MSDSDWGNGDSGDSGGDASSSGGDWSSGDESAIGVDNASGVGKGPDLAFCYVSDAWAVPNVTIYAPSREEADRKAPTGRSYCHDGPCKFEGKFEPIDEGCS